MLNATKMGKIKTLPLLFLFIFGMFLIPNSSAVDSEDLTNFCGNVAITLTEDLPYDESLVVFRGVNITDSETVFGVYDLSDNTCTVNIMPSGILFESSWHDVENNDIYSYTSGNKTMFKYDIDTGDYTIIGVLVGSTCNVRDIIQNPINTSRINYALTTSFPCTGTFNSASLWYDKLLDIAEADSGSEIHGGEELDYGVGVCNLIGTTSSGGNVDTRCIVLNSDGDATANNYNQCTNLAGGSLHLMDSLVGGSRMYLSSQTGICELIPTTSNSFYDPPEMPSSSIRGINVIDELGSGAGDMFVYGLNGAAYRLVFGQPATDQSLTTPDGTDCTIHGLYVDYSGKLIYMGFCSDGMVSTPLSGGLGATQGGSSSSTSSSFNATGTTDIFGNAKESFGDLFGIDDNGGAFFLAFIILIFFIAIGFRVAGVFGSLVSAIFGVGFVVMLGFVPVYVILLVGMACIIGASMIIAGGGD